MSEAAIGTNGSSGDSSLTTRDEHCDICGATAGRIVLAREMMFGLREIFRYWECDVCGCVQLLDFPNDMSRHYPSNYYSYQPPEIPPPIRGGAIRTWALRKRNLAIAREDRGFWGTIARVRPRRDFSLLNGLLRDTTFRSHHIRILEVGCGSGHLLRLLASAGFDSLLGVDPFIREEVHVGRTLRIEAKSIFEVQEDQFDLILFNHSLEHMPNHVGTLAHVRRLLASDGVCRISLPIAGSDPWRKYREHWVELDAPRHYFLHTPKSLSIAARNSGLSIFAVRHDGIPFGYWGSELYRRDISLRDGDLTRRPEAYFSTSDLHGFALESRRANLEGTAGRASFLLRIDQSMALERVCMVAPRGRAGSERP